MTVLSLPAIAPSRSSRMTARHHINHIRFGQGHGVRILDGVQPLDIRWNVVWEGLISADAKRFQAVLEQSRGINHFLWQPPGATASYGFICTEWQIRPVTHEYATLEAVLAQVIS